MDFDLSVSSPEGVKMNQATLNCFRKELDKGKLTWKHLNIVIMSDIGK